MGLFFEEKASVAHSRVRGIVEVGQFTAEDAEGAEAARRRKSAAGEETIDGVTSLLGLPKDPGAGSSRGTRPGGGLAAEVQTSTGSRASASLRQDLRPSS
jgi:hypothetical protein